MKKLGRLIKINKINILSSDTYNKIAAGEVVERPVSVIKELVENSIDSGASIIHIEVLSGGKDLIRVVDDGEGIYEKDLRNAFAAHGTSKIRNADDLFKISTMGFRGEALSSIASVSKVLLRSKVEGYDGREIYLEGGDVKYEKFSPVNGGTIIEIRDLFYNVPARQKFLKSDSHELSLISSFIKEISLSYPEISFSLVADNKKRLSTFGKGTQKDVIMQVYNKTIYDNLIEFEGHYDALSIYGYIGKEIIARGSRTNQTIFVNKRLINSKSITNAVERAFKSFATSQKFPFFVLNIEVYPEIIDVNIHPQKSEIKFEDERFITRSVFNTVHEAIRENLKDSFDINPVNRKDEKLSELKEDYMEMQFDFDTKKTLDFPIDISKSFKETEKVGDLATPYLDSKIKVYKSRKDDGEASEDEDRDTDINLEKLNLKAKFPMPRIIGSFKNTYILSEIYDNLFIIDQHAAHEKINYEKYIQQIKEGSVNSQELLVPEVIELAEKDFAFYMDNIDVLENAGFSSTEFGLNTIALTSVPYFIGKTQNTSYFLEILDNLKSLESGEKEIVKHLTIANTACKASVRARDYLTREEMEYLVDNLRHLEDPFHCPHGRPTIIKFTEEEIEKMFRRIV